MDECGHESELNLSNLLLASYIECNLPKNHKDQGQELHEYRHNDYPEATWNDEGTLQ